MFNVLVKEWLNDEMTNCAVIPEYDYVHIAVRPAGAVDRQA